MTEKTVGLEEVSAFKLTTEEVERLYEQQAECTVCWTTKDGWPMGMTHNFVWSDGSFWVTMSSQRKRVQALRDRPQSCIVVSSKATSFGSGSMVAVKTLATMHEDRERLRWFIPRFLERVGFPQDQFDQYFTPRRIVVEFKPVEVLSFSSHALRSAMAAQAGRAPN
jgi:hypothetical protein